MASSRRFCPFLPVSAPPAAPLVSETHLLLIPSFNTGGGLLLRTVRAALEQWAPVWVVLDGCTDDSREALRTLTAETAPNRLRVIDFPTNRGKGAAIEAALPAAAAAGFTHVLTFDADGQHPARRVPEFMAISADRPEAMVLGQPDFGPEAPRIRLQGRKISNFLCQLETAGPDIADALFGFRIYPIAPLRRAFARTRHGRRYDFEPELAVRLRWAGVPALNVPAPCRYLGADEDGVSHYHYLRDNLRMAGLHTRLLLEWPRHLPRLVAPRLRRLLASPKTPRQ